MDGETAPGSLAHGPRPSRLRIQVDVTLACSHNRGSGSIRTQAGRTAIRAPETSHAPQARPLHLLPRAKGTDLFSAGK